MAEIFFFSSRRRHTRLQGDWSSDVCSSDLVPGELLGGEIGPESDMVLARALAQGVQVRRLDARARREGGRRGESARLQENRLYVLVRHGSLLTNTAAVKRSIAELRAAGQRRALASSPPIHARARPAQPPPNTVA